MFASVSYVTGVSKDFSWVDTASSGGTVVSEERKAMYDRAIADFTQAIRLDPNDTKAYTERGSAYNAKGDNDRAIADFTQALRLNSNDVAAYNNRGNAYYYKGD